MDIKSKLTHKADVYTQGTKDASGIPSFVYDRTIDCFAWGTRSRAYVGSQPQTSIVTISFRVITLGSESFTNGDQLRDVIDENGSSIFEKGTIVQVVPVTKRVPVF